MGIIICQALNSEIFKLNENVSGETSFFSSGQGKSETNINIQNIDTEVNFFFVFFDSFALFTG